MTAWMTILVIATLLGSALIGGVFFAFSSFIMNSLARLPAAEGIAAMQSINVVVLNRWFLDVFIGTAVLSLVLVVIAVLNWGDAPAAWFLSGGTLYVVGTFLVTGMGNVPLNDRLAAVSAQDASSAALWEHYLDRWTLLNTVRTVAAVAAALCLTLGLIGGNHA